MNTVQVLPGMVNIWQMPDFGPRAGLGAGVRRFEAPPAMVLPPLLSRCLQVCREGGALDWRHLIDYIKILIIMSKIV
jgi:hypothetical protein